jgi:Double zinc ribbon
MSARLSSLFARRDRRAPPPGGGDAVEAVQTPLTQPAQAGPPAPPSNPAVMARERRALGRRREIELRDVGGLTVEMVRRDRLNTDLLASRAGEVLELERRIHELDSLLAAEGAVRGVRGVTHCKCGAPLAPGVHFCSHCGRPAAATPPVLTCTRCGQPLPADVNFCSVCGNAVAAEKYLAIQTGSPVEDTLTRPQSAEDDWLGNEGDRPREG